MTIDEFRNFIDKHRERFSTKDNNLFGFALAKVDVKWEYLNIIRGRYRVVSKAFVENSKAFYATLKEGGGDLTNEQQSMYYLGQRLMIEVHLDIDSFYIFAKMLLDDVARTVEFYFGGARGLSLNSHDGLTKNLERFVSAKGLTIPGGMGDRITDLKRRIADFRDQQIAHENNPRTAKGTMTDAEGHVRWVALKLYPKPGEEQRESEDIDILHGEIENYIGDVVSILEANAKRSKLAPLR